MNDSNENINVILAFLKKHQSKLNIKSFLNILTTALIIGSIFFMLFEVIALFVPLYYVHIYGISAVIISLLAALIFHLLHKVSLKTTALFLDSFGFKEGLITAIENKDKDLAIFDIQRKQVLNSINKKAEGIKYTIHPPYKNILILLGVLCVAIGLTFVPTPAKAEAKENHELVKQIHEKEKQISELINELNEKSQEPLSKHDEQALNDLLAALSSSYSEYQNVTTSQQLLAANERLSYKLEQIENNLTSEDLNNLIKDHIPKTSPYGYLQADNNGNTNASPNQQNNNGTQNNNGNNDQNGNNGQGNNGQGNNGQGNGQGDNNNNNNNGQNSSQSGQGRGEGSSNNQRDYISIPNPLSDDPSLEGQGKTKDDNQQFLAQNGLNFEGEHVPYSQVISEYTDQAYDGISQGKYPSNMENVIKDYFSSFN